MAEILSMISTVSFALAAFFLALAVGFAIKFRVGSIIGDLSGRTARKSIARMRENNEKTGAKLYKPSKVNQERGKVTDKVGGTEHSITGYKQSETGILFENQASYMESSPTDILNPSEAETTGLLEENTEVLEENVTIALEVNEMAALDENRNNTSKKEEGIEMFMIEDVVLIHTMEVI